MYQLGFAIINIVFTIIMPIVTYLNFKNISFDCPECPESFVTQISLGGTKELYDILIYVFVCIGVIVTLCSYIIDRFQKYSIQRGILMYIVSVVYLINVIFASQMSEIYLQIANIHLIANFFGVYILFITISSLYVLKSLFDLIDFKINKYHYDKIIRREKAVRVKQKGKKVKQKGKKVKKELVECLKCKYTCRPEWKKCPICETKL